MPPLLAIDSPHAPMMVRADRTIVAGEFIAAVEMLVESLPRARHIINLCERRYGFLLGLVAAILREHLILLPPNRAPGTLEDLRQRFDDCLVLDDALMDQYVRDCAPTTALPNWRVAAERVVALTFTSGSTGAPQAHAKTWRTLARNAELAATEILGGARTQLVATVPAQHVYGLETTALTALSAQCAVFDEKPFFPSDVRSALAAMSAPRTLVTTPTHLRTLIEAQVPMPPLQRVVSATAPLSVELAERIEQSWSTQVFEIYGCTEAGIMANRRTIARKPWRTFSGGTMTVRDGTTYYEAPQLPSAIPLQDVIEATSSVEFTLLGRAADMIKVAGKRASLQALTQMLLGIEGVRDAAVFVPQADARPAALVVAPGLSAQSILQSLRQRIDPVFLPRPLVSIDKLPRNELGKLPHDALLELLRAHRTKR